MHTNHKPVSATLALDNQAYDTDEAALYLFGTKGKRHRLEKWRSTGVGPRYVKVGPRTIRYRKVDLDDFILANLREPGPDPDAGQ
jgi:hypothetical protein